jgi:hypothetical protein
VSWVQRLFADQTHNRLRRHGKDTCAASEAVTEASRAVPMRGARTSTTDALAVDAERSAMRVISA